MKRIAVVGLVLALMALGLAAPSVQAHGPKAHDACANALCTKEKPHVKSCWKAGSRQQITRCFVRRAALHFREPVSLALYVSWRESRYDYRAQNTAPCDRFGHHAKGPFQFCYQLWNWKKSVYGKMGKSPFNPKWAALAAMRLWSRGCSYHWIIRAPLTAPRLKGC